MEDGKSEVPAATPLHRPRDGTPGVVSDPESLARACAQLDAGSGAFAIDTERASGYRYWQKAYLVQVRSEGAGTHLIDPIPLAGQLEPLAEALNGQEWVLHAASQDLPCLAELGLLPGALFDTELAGRLAGYDRVALGTMVQLLLGYQLEKGHSAADWSTRPLPSAWLDYAALDVELLLELKDKLQAELAEQGKLEWARQEFEALRTAEPPPPRPQPWRRTSGIHKVRTPRALAVVRALWYARDDLARQRDRAPGRVLPDNAIVAAATQPPESVEQLRSLSVFGGRMQRRMSSMWLSHIQQAQHLPRNELPSSTTQNDGPPPTNRWADKDPDAAARLKAARAALHKLAEQHNLPVENLLQPDLMRRLCWEPPEAVDAASVSAALAERGARPWQIELTAEPLTTALSATAE